MAANSRLRRSIGKVGSILTLRPKMVRQVSDETLQKVYGAPETSTAANITIRKELANRLVGEAASQSPRRKRTAKYR